MKLPEKIASVTPCWDRFKSAYPPLGFYPIAERQLGNGDTYGLYWPIGYEDRDPIVAETVHDSWQVCPRYSCLDTFLDDADNYESRFGDDDDDDLEIDDTYDSLPSIVTDPRSPFTCVQAARESLKSQNFDFAIQYLEIAIDVLPEYTEALALLSNQYRRLGQHDLAIRTAIRAITSPPSFGACPMQLASWLARQTSAPDDLIEDPIWNHRECLTLQFGGVKENSQYAILRNAIETYLSASNFIAAMTLMQTFGELMASETVSFREREHFIVDEHIEWQRYVAAKLYGRPRDPDTVR